MGNKIIMQTTAGAVTVIPYDDGIAEGVQIMIDGAVVCMLDVYKEDGEARVLVYHINNDEEPDKCITVNR